MFEKLKKSPSYKIEIEKSAKKLEFILSKIPENLINVFNLDSEEGSQDIELAILRAFLNCNILEKNCDYIRLKINILSLYLY
jgi:hypothetical protein